MSIDDVRKCIRVSLSTWSLDAKIAEAIENAIIVGIEASAADQRRHHHDVEAAMKAFEPHFCNPHWDAALRKTLTALTVQGEQKRICPPAAFAAARALIEAQKPVSPPDADRDEMLLAAVKVGKETKQ